MRKPKQTTVVACVDAQGEVHDGVPVLCYPKVKSIYGNEWMQTSQEFQRELAKRKDVTGEVLRVYLFLNSVLDFENVIRVPQTVIAKELDLQPPNVNRAIRKLIELGILIKGPQPSSWRLNTNVGWKGKVANLNRRAHLELVR